jgi:hypothetical protein
MFIFDTYNSQTAGKEQHGINGNNTKIWLGIFDCGDKPTGFLAGILLTRRLSVEYSGMALLP